MTKKKKGKKESLNSGVAQKGKGERKEGELRCGWANAATSDFVRSCFTGPR